MCRILKVTRSLVYYSPRPRKTDVVTENAVIEEFTKNYKVYGTRKIRKALKRRATPILASRRRIGKIMEKYNLVSKYVKRRKRARMININKDDTPNKVNRNFSGRKPLEVVVSDLTYVKVNSKWHYVCLLLDLSSREIIGHAAGRRKDASLIRTAFYRIKADLRRVRIFHTDRGSEFKNEVIDSIVSAFGIERSLSAKGVPIDNAVAESMYNILKTELVYGEEFLDLDDLELKLFDYANWYNNVRLHGSLDYITPSEYKAWLQSTYL
jgi:transposase InsO family protein